MSRVSRRSPIDEGRGCGAVRAPADEAGPEVWTAETGSNLGDDEPPAQALRSAAAIVIGSRTISATHSPVAFTPQGADRVLVARMLEYGASSHEDASSCRRRERRRFAGDAAVNFQVDRVT